MHALPLIRDKRKPNSNDDQNKTVLLFQWGKLQTTDLLLLSEYYVRWFSTDRRKEDVCQQDWLTCLILWLRCWILLETVWQTFCQKIKYRDVRWSSAQIPDTRLSILHEIISTVIRLPYRNTCSHISNVVVQGTNRWTSRSDTYLLPLRNCSDM